MIDLSNGHPATPEEILQAREARGQRLEDLVDAFPNRTFLSFKLNIPGLIKSHPILDLLFDQAVAKLTARLAVFEIHDLSHGITGPELILSTPRAALITKRLMIELEEATPLGRLYDMDVLDQGVAVSRSDLLLPERSCLLCGQPARICSRSSAHALSDVLTAIEDIIAQEAELSPWLKPRIE